MFFFSYLRIFSLTMAISKHKLGFSLRRKDLKLEWKIKLLGSYEKRKQSCLQLAEQFNIGKTVAVKIIKNEASFCKEYKLFKGKIKIKRMGQFHDIHEILHAWFQKCCTVNTYSDGVTLKEEAMEHKKFLDPEEFRNLTASSGLLQKWTLSYGVRERKVNGYEMNVKKCLNTC